MKKLNYWALAVMLVFNLSTAACSENNKVSAKVTSEEVKALVENELAVGASAQDIEQFFKKHADLFKDIHPPYYSYDRIQNLYHNIIRDVSPMFDHSIEVDIYVDDQKRLKKIDVRDTFTMP